MAIAEDFDDEGQALEHEEAKDAFPSQEHIKANNAKRGKYVGEFVPPPRFDSSELKHISVAEGQLIRQYAKTMDEDEIAFMLGIDFSKLDVVSLRYFQTEFTRGQLEARHQAGEALFSAMKKNNSGLQAALAYLERFGGEEWKEPEHSGNDSVRTLSIEVRQKPDEQASSSD